VSPDNSGYPSGRVAISFEFAGWADVPVGTAALSDTLAAKAADKDHRTLDKVNTGSPRSSTRPQRPTNMRASSVGDAA